MIPPKTVSLISSSESHQWQRGNSFGLDMNKVQWFLNCLVSAQQSNYFSKNPVIVCLHRKLC